MNVHLECQGAVNVKTCLAQYSCRCSRLFCCLHPDLIVIICVASADVSTEFVDGQLPEKISKTIMYHKPPAMPGRTLVPYLVASLSLQAQTHLRKQGRWLQTHPSL